MENKKTKLTISGNTKKSIKNFNFVKNKGKKSVVIEKQSNKFTKKNSTFKSYGSKSKGSLCPQMGDFPHCHPEWG